MLEDVLREQVVLAVPVKVICRQDCKGLCPHCGKNLNLEQCFVLSNKWQDAEAASNAGCTSLLIASPWIGKGHHDIVLASLADAVNKISRLHAGTSAVAAPRGAVSSY